MATTAASMPVGGRRTLLLRNSVRRLVHHPTSLALIGPKCAVLRRAHSSFHAARVCPDEALVAPPLNKRPSRARRARPKPRLVIFDKDGTLICFHSAWIPWVLNFVAKVEEESQMEVAAKVYELLGFCPVNKKVGSGLLAEGTWRQIRESTARLLVQHGLEEAKAASIAECADRQAHAAAASAKNATRQLHNLDALFTELKARGIKIAVCTSDNRDGTLRMLREFRVDHLVDLMVCGDDAHSVPKPHPANALFICRQLGVEPRHAMMVGDTLADLGMGRAAQLGHTVGVLSGVGAHKELAPHADHLVEHVGELLALFG